MKSGSILFETEEQVVSIHGPIVYAHSLGVWRDLKKPRCRCQRHARAALRNAVSPPLHRQPCEAAKDQATLGVSIDWEHRGVRQYQCHFSW